MVSPVSPTPFVGFFPSFFSLFAFQKERARELCIIDATIDVFPQHFLLGTAFFRKS